MARCGNEALLKLISNNKLDENTRVRFNVRSDLPDCRKIDAKNYVNITQAGAYNKYARPVNRFECGRTGCLTTGTLTLTDAADTVTYRAMFDATEWGAGAITFYVKPADGATYPLTVTAKIGDKDTFDATEGAGDDFDVYTVELTEAQVTADGFIPVLIDLAKAPAQVVNNGWEPAASGAHIQLSGSEALGYSSISIYDSLEDFETNHVVEVGCLSSIGGTYDLEMVTAACQDAQYNPDVQTLTFPVSGTRATPNYYLLNPMYGKGKNVKGFENVTIEKTVEASGEQGKITLPDANADICGYISVQIADSCDVTESMLTLLSIPTPVDVDEGHFQVIRNQDGTTDLIFNKAMVGMDMLISYPKAVDIEETVINPDNLGSVHVSMSVPMKTSDGTKYVYVFDNVFVTSFPATITNAEAVFSFTFTIARDADGNFMRIQKIQ